MTKPLSKTLSFALAAFGAVASSSAGQSPVLHAAAMPMAISPSCAAQAEIERGWEAQQRLLDERLAAKGFPVEVPGTIISPPLPDFATGRAAATAAAAAKKPATAGRSSRALGGESL